MIQTLQKQEVLEKIAYIGYSILIVLFYGAKYIFDKMCIRDRINTSGYDFLKKDQRERLLLVGDVNETDYIIETYSAVSQSKKYNEFQEFDAIHSLIIDGFYVNTIFKRAYNLYSTSIVTKENGLWNFTVNDINWFCDDEELIGLLDDPVSASKFTVEFESNDLASRSSIYVSEDGSNWVCLSDQNDYTVSGNQIWGHFNTDNLAGVKICLLYTSRCV